MFFNINTDHRFKLPVTSFVREALSCRPRDPDYERERENKAIVAHDDNNGERGSSCRDGIPPAGASSS